MRKPEAILFDAGGTLLDYASIDTLKGVRAIMPYLTDNPRGLTAEEIDSFMRSLSAHCDICRKQLFEMSEQMFLRLVFDLLELRFSISFAELERILWEVAPDIRPMEGAAKLLSLLDSLGIGTGVISNFDFSSVLLRERLDALYPNHRFRFIVASSDYGVRKPSRYLFSVGAAKSGCAPEKIWYVGDKISVDVLGSRACGMTPILYKNPSAVYREIPSDITVVEHYGDLTDIMKNFRE